MTKYTLAKALLIAGTSLAAGAKEENQKLRGAQNEVSTQQIIHITEPHTFRTSHYSSFHQSVLFTNRSTLSFLRPLRILHGNMTGLIGLTRQLPPMDGQVMHSSHFSLQKVIASSCTSVSQEVLVPRAARAPFLFLVPRVARVIRDMA